MNGSQCQLRLLTEAKGKGMKEWIGPGTFLGDYEVVSRIENEVFLVRQENGAPATLKFLADNFVWEPANLKRFIQAIKAAPPLDHRNICRTFDAGATNGGRPFVVSEHIHGRTLDALEIGLLRSLAERLELASQIAEAVEAAHANGVLHLELTPGKVLVEYDRQVKDADWINEYAYSVEESKVAISFAGRVKVLDFAVMMSALGVSLTRDALALHTFTTVETLPYCSPEWVSGEKLTQQSDIFSLGVLVYELLTGKRPFRGESLEEIRWAIFTEDPRPLLEFVPELNPAINRAVLKALAKAPEDRFQTAGEFARALRGLVQTETESELQRAAAAAKQARTFKLRWQAFWPQALSAIRDNWRRGVAGAIVLFEVFFIAAILIHSRRGAAPEVPNDGPREGLPLTRITNKENVREAVLAPDASGVVYVIEDPERQSILYKPYGQKTKDGKPLPEILLANSKTARFAGLAYAPSGESVYYLSTVPGEATALLRVPVNGGPTQTLLTDAASALGFAPDHKQFAFARTLAGETQLVISTLSAATPRVLVSWPSPNALAATAPAWSRDGKTIVCALRRADNGLAFDLVALDVESGNHQTLTAGKWAEVYGIGWSPDNRSLLVNGRGLGLETGQIWRVNVPSGECTALTKGLDDFRGLSTSADGTRLLTVFAEHKAELWLGLNEQARRLPAINVEAHAGFGWLNEQQLVYAVQQSSGIELREIGTDGQPAKLFRQLEAGVTLHGFAPASSLDSQNPSATFAAFQQQRMNIWQAARGKMPLTALTSSQFALWPQLSTDGCTLLYSSLINGKPSFARQDIANATSQDLWPQRAWAAVFSPNGEFVAANIYEEQQGTWRLSIWTVKGGNEILTMELPSRQPQRLRWTPDNQAIVYSANDRGAENLWQQALAGGSPVPLTKLTKQRFYDFAWSVTGQQIAVMRGEEHREAFLLSTDKLTN